MSMTSPASASVVNRTHRIVRARAMQIKAQKSKTRSLWLPVTFGGLLLIAACYATAVILNDQEDGDGMMYASEQIFVLLMWLIPVSAAVMSVIWYKRDHTNVERGVQR